MPAPLVVVFDTNVVIPLSLRSGRSLSTRLLARLRRAGHLVAISPQMCAEVREKLLEKKSLRTWLGVSSDEQIEKFVSRLPAILGHAGLAGAVTTPGVVKADHDDDTIIAAAVEANASYIVSEDRHLLDLKEYQGTKILDRKAFAAELDRLGVP